MIDALAPPAPIDPVAELLANPEQMLFDVEKELAERRLEDFIAQEWHALEPAREFKHGWHIGAIGEHLTAITENQITRLLINVPPGFMKSMTTNVFWPAWEWGPRNRPTTRYVSASYSQDLTIRDNRRCRQLIRSETYQQRWGDRFQMDPSQDAKTRFDNDKTGFRIATSVGGLGTGERGDRFIIDDPHNVKDGESEAKREATILWFTETVTSRMNDPLKSAIIIIMQRVHERDVSGVIMARNLGYEHLMLPMEYEPDRVSYTRVRPSWAHGQPTEVRWQPLKGHFKAVSDMTPEEVTEADKREMPVLKRWCQDQRTEEGEQLWPERFPEEAVARDRKAAGEYAYAGQYQQRPSPRGGAMFQRHWFQIVQAAPVGGTDVRGWDLAATPEAVNPDAAFTAGVRVRLANDGRLYVMDVVRGQWGPLDVDKAIKNTATQDGFWIPQDIPQDPGAAGKTVITHFLKLLAGYTVRFSPETGEKEARAQPVASQAEAGNVLLVAGAWNEAFLEELASFPKGAYKDQVDALSRAYASILAYREDTAGADGGIYSDGGG